MSVFTYLQSLPVELATVIAAMLPITELRGSIPVAITVWDIPPVNAYFLSVLGNLLPMFAIMYTLDPLQKTVERISPKSEKFFNWLYDRTRRKMDEKYRKYGAFALFLFVAVPLPMTGVWTGSLAAWLFGISKPRAFTYITLGALTAGIIVTAITLGFTFVI